MKRPSGKWQVRVVVAAAAQVDADVVRIAAEGGWEAVHSFVASQVRKLSDDHTPRGEVRRFYLLLASLRHHEEHGGLTRQQTADALALARDLLRANGIDPVASRLAFMHAQLETVAGLLARRRGHHWAALFAHERALASSSTGEGAQTQLQWAQGLLRSGHGAVAAAALTNLSTDRLTDNDAADVCLWRARTARLTGDTGQALAHLEALRFADLTAQQRHAVTWEAACLELGRAHNAGPMLACLRRRGTHRQAQYLLEGSLWAKVVPPGPLLVHLSLVRSLSRNKALRLPDCGRLYRSALALEQCYDQDVALAARLAKLAVILEQTKLLKTVEQELLVWAAAGRFLLTTKSTALARVVLAEYAALSMRLSQGLSCDVLHLTGDLVLKLRRAG